MHRFGQDAEEFDDDAQADFITKEFDADFIRESESVCIKCGEMYLKDNSELIFICTDCNKRFNTVDGFKAHILVHYEEALQPVPSVESLLDDVCYEESAEIDEFTLHCFEDNAATSSSEHNQQNETSCSFDYKQQNTTSSAFDNNQETSQAAVTSDRELESIDDTDDLNDCSMAGDEADVQASKMKIDKVERPEYKCDVCYKTFTYQNGLRMHSKIHTIRPRFNCNDCGMSYVNRMNLVIHQRRHTGEKPYACKYCAERFMTSTLRNKHQNEHTGRKPYNCVKCKASFATSMQLLNHDRIKHLDLRRFQCTACGKRFRQNVHLQAHSLAMHDDLNRVKEKCEFCDAVFKTKVSLAVHMKVHEGKQFKCTICQKAYSSYSSVHAHMKKHKRQGD